MTDDRQDFEEWWRTVHPLGTTAFFAEDHWCTFQAALRIAAERRKQEEPVAWTFSDALHRLQNGEAGSWIVVHGHEASTGMVPLLLRDPDDKQ